MDSVIDPNDLVGNYVGKYKILKLQEENTKFDNCKYKVYCTKCGMTTVDSHPMRAEDIFKTAYNDICHHSLMRAHDYIGETIGKYHIIDYLGKYKNGHDNLFKVRCNICGFEGNMAMSAIKKSSNKNNCNHVNITGWKNNIIRTKYYSMIYRCYNPNNLYYSAYGGRGIKICDEWLNDPLSFQDWAYNNGYEEGLTIDRINNDGDYCPDNCQWVTPLYNSKFAGYATILHIKIGNVDLYDTIQGWSIRLFNNKHYISSVTRNLDNENKIKTALQIIINNLPKNLFYNNDGTINPVVIYDNEKPINYDFDSNNELVKKF